ncbi:hypothetical protein M378DRAFT_183322 [Amanita muscaria Koide BX008]|uniref:M protein, serotype 2.1 n=1 Tax=Amanita muscaria (strain Koide BX008) TaxID=946122 RepID=A0A0C2XMD2_AMAMK|nr:hypothetical protein M378DRAFT_183322 [Amanita muscaria Koide BX008]
MNSSRAIPPARRAPTPSSPPPITKGATARSAASPRVSSSLNSPATRRSSPKVNGDSKETLSASLKHETDQKEQLLIQLQDKEQALASLTTDNDSLTSALNAAESRLNELYTEQSRSEVELAQRIDIIDKLRAQVRETEREKRDLQRRYNEQTASFEAERQAFYDNEQHLKSRIQSLTQARKQTEPEPEPVQMIESDVEHDGDAQPLQDEVNVDKQHSPKHVVSEQQDFTDPDSEPAEMTALKLELSTLSTSYASLQSTLVLLQTQLVDLKRVNRELQEENESYMILLREKTLSGQFDVMRQVGGVTSESENDDDDDDERDSVDVRSLRSTGRSTLDKVDELPESLDLELEQSLGSHDHSASSRSSGRHSRNRSTSIRGESLADLPITGPGLDLAAELGRAENKDILSGTNLDDRDRLGPPGKKRSKKGSDGRKVSAEHDQTNDIDALRTEVKSLKDANKALSLYASKIIDRIIAQEGYEHVLAADYEAEPKTPMTATQTSAPKPTITVTNSPPKARPQSAWIGRSSSSGPAPTTDSNPATPRLSQPTNKAQRRSLSFDWKGFSFFSGGPEKKSEPNLRPLTLTPGSAPITGARKLETYEDEEDRKERERLNATMKLMGIEPQTPVPASMERASSVPSSTQSVNNRRFSFFGQPSSSLTSIPGGDNALVGLGIDVSSNLTQEALVQVEAENTIAALEAQERSLSAELARGSGSGFTEIAPRSIGKRGRRSVGGSGSGSTVWSAGMSANDE